MKTGTEAAIEVLKKLEAMPQEEFMKLMEEQEGKPHHWATQVMIDIGYFDRLGEMTMRHRTELEYKSFPKQDNWLVRKFKWEDVIVHEITKRMQPKSRATRQRIMDNCEKFIHWVKNILLEIAPSEIPKNHRLNALCTYMTQRNIEYLHQNLDPYVWLDLAPKACDELEDDEYAIDPEEVVTVTEWPESIGG